MAEGRVKMRVLKGIPASGGVAIGKGFFLNRVLPRSVRSTVGREQVDEEVVAFQRAVARPGSSSSRSATAWRDSSSEHHQILRSIWPSSMTRCSSSRRSGRSVKTSSPRTGRSTRCSRTSWRRSNGSRIRTCGSGGHDLRQIGHRVLENLAGRPVDSIAAIRDPVVIVAHDLSPRTPRRS